MESLPSFSIFPQQKAVLTKYWITKLFIEKLGSQNVCYLPNIIDPKNPEKLPVSVIFKDIVGIDSAFLGMDGEDKCRRTYRKYLSTRKHTEAKSYYHNTYIVNIRLRV